MGNYKRLVSHKINNREKRCSPWPLVFLKAQVELNQYVRNFWHHKMVHLITHLTCDPICFPLPEEISKSKKLPQFMKPWFYSRQNVIKRMVREYLLDMRFAVDCFTFLQLWLRDWVLDENWFFFHMSDDGDHYYSFDRVDFYCGNISPQSGLKTFKKNIFHWRQFSSYCNCVFIYRLYILSHSNPIQSAQGL